MKKLSILEFDQNVFQTDVQHKIDIKADQASDGLLVRAPKLKKKKYTAGFTVPN